MTNPAKRIFDLLGELGARPECLGRNRAGIWCDHEEEGAIMSDANALAILRDAARRVCDGHGVVIESEMATVYSARSKHHGFREYLLHPCHAATYESALIAALEHILENRNG